MSIVSSFWRKHSIKDKIRAKVDAELPKLEFDIAKIIFEQSNGKVTLMEAQSAAKEVIAALKQIVDKVL